MVTGRGPLRAAGEDPYVDNVKRKERFLAEHPEWTIVYVRSMGYYEACRDEPNTVITDYRLDCMLNRVEKATEG